MKNITQTQYNFICKEVEMFNEKTNGFYSVTEHDVIHSFFVDGEYLNDYDEGMHNDKYRVEGQTKHTVFEFIDNLVSELSK
jgi:hypothetical protein